MENLWIWELLLSIKFRFVHVHDELTENILFVDDLDICTMIEQVARFSHVDRLIFFWREIQKCNMKFPLLTRIICRFIKIIWSRERGLEEEKQIFVVTVGTVVENLMQLGTLTILNSAFHRAWYYEEPLTLELIIWQFFLAISIKIPESDHGELLTILVDHVAKVLMGLLAYIRIVAGSRTFNPVRCLFGF